MPRQKTIVMKGLTPEERRQAVLKKAIETHDPYKVFRDTREGAGKSYVIVLTNPHTQHRTEVASGFRKKSKAQKLLRLLERAWAEGYISSSQD